MDEKLVKKWQKLNFKQRCRSKISVGGGKDSAVLGFAYIEELAKKLPEAVIKDTQEPIDHHKELKERYISFGPEGINDYVKLILGAKYEKEKELHAINMTEIAKEKEANG